MFVAAAVLFAAGAADAAPEPIGAERCGACHVKELADWKKSAHARALARLSAPKQRDPICRSCHTTAPTKSDPALSGVQCESCHGAGSLYAPDYVMRDEELREMLGLAKVTEATCRACHDGETPSTKPFDFATWVKLVDHKSDKGDGS